MESLSPATLGHLVEVAESASSSTIRTLLMKSRVFELSGAPSSFLSQKNMVNRSELIRQPLLKVHGKASAGDSGAHRALLDFIVVWASGCNIRTIGVGRFRERIAELCESLRADGYELTVSDDCKVQLIPTDSSAAPLAPEITALVASNSVVYRPSIGPGPSVS